jgi:hypothetical protein
MEEQFKNITGFENYSISNFGNVANVKTGRILKPGLDNHGYLKVDLYIKRKGHTKKIHRLIAEAFIPNPNNKPCVDHIDNNILNNNINNLRWATYSENCMNASLSKANKFGVKGVFYFGKTNKYVAQIKHNNKHHHLGLFDSLEEAKEARQKKANELFGQFTNKCEKIKTELEELLELEKELEDLINLK